MFIDTTKQPKKLPVVAFSNIRPNTGPMFLWHLMLTMGEIDNEMELLLNRTYRKMFEKVKLLKKDQNGEEAAICITKRYVTGQLKYYPISSQQFDYFLVTAYNLIRSSIVMISYV